MNDNFRNIRTMEELKTYSEIEMNREQTFLSEKINPVDWKKFYEVLNKTLGITKDYIDGHKVELGGRCDNNDNQLTELTTRINELEVNLLGRITDNYQKMIVDYQLKDEKIFRLENKITELESKFSELEVKYSELIEKNGE